MLKARKLSSALSASKAVSDHVRDWWFGTSEDEWVSMAVLSDDSYGMLLLPCPHLSRAKSEMGRSLTISQLRSGEMRTG